MVLASGLSVFRLFRHCCCFTIHFTHILRTTPIPLLCLWPSLVLSRFTFFRSLMISLIRVVFCPLVLMLINSLRANLVGVELCSLAACPNHWALRAAMGSLQGLNPVYTCSLEGFCGHLMRNVNINSTHWYPSFSFVVVCVKMQFCNCTGTLYYSPEL